MFNMGWTELLVIGVVALIVIGPQDLPEMFRQLGRFTGKIRAMGREFQRAMDQAAKDSGAKDVAKDLRTMTSPKSLGIDAVKDAADRFEKWDPLKQTKPAPKPATSATPAPETAGPAALAGAAPAAEKSAPAKPAPGPATQALAEKQAARKAVIADTAAKLKAIDKGEAAAAPAAAPKAAAAAQVVDAAPAKPARAPRKKKAPEA
ncbi:Sec-independent protein translocase protein TatB [Albidovulum sediminis]|uniref:Sec-independent protein translocase protein TatB n=1 Tax=Albidovulum sediminis TaxID=3066345 RepID=A0ABT2NI30_9RHOB|nr:Sec-independent protein translocase protein TatB [Defluviimonas sediminis]MCT8328566.1 Sec-independent protein translocase protein TatB [Defluviimonas sediminis]